MSLVILIDDDKQLCTSFLKILRQEEYTTVAAHTGLEGVVLVERNRPDLVILDIRLPDMSGLEVFERIHRSCPKIPVIIITAYGTTETAISAIQKGAYDYIYKPFDVEQMLVLVEKAIRAGHCMSKPVEINPDEEHLSAGEALVGKSAKMLEIYKAIGRVAFTDATVLIRGESGTGKELAARAVYNHSSRTDKPYTIINCVAIPETLLESELFGYEKGAFTGAVHRKVGKIEQARGGTIFLDEIGDLPLSLQSKFLRLLQENTIERIGGKESIEVDVRIIAATNRDLEAAVADGCFREDLYYRLRVVTLSMPPLRERREDIPLLCHYLMARLADELGVNNPGLLDSTLAMLSNYSWPGNIRELMNTLKKSMIFNRGNPLQPEDVSLVEDRRENNGGSDMDSPESIIRSWVHHELITTQSAALFDHCIDMVSSLLVQEALGLCSGNRTQAAKLLGISRPTLHARIDKYQLSGGLKSDSEQEKEDQYTLN